MSDWLNIGPGTQYPTLLEIELRLNGNGAALGISRATASLAVGIKSISRRTAAPTAAAAPP